LVGFPSYSFKNKGGKTTNNNEQTKQFETFRLLLDQARQAGKQVLILTHTPEIDDPYTLGQDRYAAKSPDPSADKDPKNPRSPWSAWNISTKLLDGWKEVLQSDTVAAVLAGHLHDSHKEIYRRPYTWSTADNHRLGFQKLFLAPPLAVKNQDGSPIQARGFSLVTLQPNHIEALLYWYNQETGEFRNEATSLEHRPRTHFWGRGRGLLRAMWQLDQAESPLLRLATLLIALLTAYLTVVAIWNIPPVQNWLAPDSGKPANGPTSAAKPSPFASNFGQTVIAGLLGLAVTEMAKVLGGGDQSASSSGSRYFYIVWFIAFFFVLLFSLSFLRGCAEGLRAMVAIPRYSLARPAGSDAVSYWWLRFVHWLFSLRVPLLTGFDTLINLVQGKNQTLTGVFEKTIIEQQGNLVRVADAIRKDLTKLIEHQLGQNSPSSIPLASPVRIGISVLSADQTKVFYISRSPGSANMAFIKHSVAWLSVFTGEIRWFESTFEKLPEYKDMVLFDNSGGTIAGEVANILLASYYQPRHEDYQAFVVLPVPWPQRGMDTRYVKGAVHISFRSDTEFEQIWKAPVPKGEPPVYPPGQNMLVPAKPGPDAPKPVPTAAATLPIAPGSATAAVLPGTTDPDDAEGWCLHSEICVRTHQLNDDSWRVAARF
jgi:hypothetical protein